MSNQGIKEYLKDFFSMPKKDICQEMNEAGTGFMLSLTDGIQKLKEQGYKDNLVPKFDHLEFDMGRVKLYPQDFTIDKMIRFENTSDPGDQSILYAISCPEKGVKGVYVESYGTYHDELSELMLERLKDHPH